MTRTSSVPLHAGDMACGAVLGGGLARASLRTCRLVRWESRPPAARRARLGAQRLGGTTHCAQHSQKSQSSGVKELLAAVSMERGVFPAADRGWRTHGEIENWGTCLPGAAEAPKATRVSKATGGSCGRGPGGTKGLLAENRGACTVHTGWPLSGGFHLPGCTWTCLHGHGHRPPHWGPPSCPTRMPGALARWPPSDL